MTKIESELLEACQYAYACLSNQLSTRTKHEYALDKLSSAIAKAESAVSEPSHRTTGWVAPKDHYAVPVLFNPYTGEPRDARDIASDPQGILIVPLGKVEMLAAKPAAAVSEPVKPVAWAEKYAKVILKFKDYLAEKGARPVTPEKAVLWDEAFSVYEQMVLWANTPPAAVPQWMPIESAPKDGTPVLLFARHVNATASTRVVGSFVLDSWFAKAYFGQSTAPLVPSHWMPLFTFPNGIGEKQ